MNYAFSYIIDKNGSYEFFQVWNKKNANEKGRSQTSKLPPRFAKKQATGTQQAQALAPAPAPAGHCVPTFPDADLQLALAP